MQSIPPHPIFPKVIYMGPIFPHSCYMHGPPNLPPIDNSIYIWRRVQITQPLVTQFSTPNFHRPTYLINKFADKRNILKQTEYQRHKDQRVNQDYRLIVHNMTLGPPH
jgi:hypothetical protein